MNKDQLLTFAKKLGLKKIDGKTRKGWVVSRCPFAHFTHEKGTDQTPAFALQIGKRFFNCFACDMHGDLDYLLLRLAVFTQGNKAAALLIGEAREYLEHSVKTVLTLATSEEEVDDADELIEFPEWYISAYPTCYDHPYLQTRKGGPVPFEIAKRMDFRLDWKKQRVGVPIRDFDGSLMGFHGRSFTGHKLPYLAYTFDGHWNRPVWSGENRIDLTKPLILTESIFDEARVAQCYRNVCCPLSASLNEIKIKRMGSALKLIDMFDNDKAGLLASKKIAATLTDSLISKPGGVEGYKDPGETPIHELAELLSKYVTLDPILT